MPDYILQKTGNQIDAILLRAVLRISGSYASVEALTAAHPSGDTNLYDIGGYWYFWNGSAWTQGGITNFDYTAKFVQEVITYTSDIETLASSSDWILYQNGHIFYATTQKAFYIKVPVSPGYQLFNHGVLADTKLLLRVEVSTETMDTFFTAFGTRVINVSIAGTDYLVSLKNNASIVAIRLEDMKVYKAASSAISSSTTLVNILGNSAYAQTLTTEEGVSKHQTTTILIRGPLENINGRTFQHYTSTEVTVGGYDCIKLLKDGNKCTEQDAAEYMEYMTGSYYVPKYNYDKPRSTYFVQPDGQLLKPQFDDTNGLLLYKMSTLALKNYVDNTFRTEEQVDDQIDAKLAKIVDIEDLEENKNYSYKIVVKEDGELVMRITEVE